MASFWANIGRWLDSVLGAGGNRSDDVDPAKVEAAIHLIQTTIEEEQRQRQVRKLRVSDLEPERQAQLANELAHLLRKPPAE
jgi:DNA replicative helicase MCM subunit Mcm2 (Cdc46/Mcm family)